MREGRSVLRRWGRLLSLGLALTAALVLIACGAEAVASPTPRPLGHLACFLPLDAVPAEGTPQVPRKVAIDRARLFWQNGLIYLGEEPIDVRYLTVTASSYRVQSGADPLRRRDVWLVGFSVVVAPEDFWFRAGDAVYVLIDARTSLPLVSCKMRP